MGAGRKTETFTLSEKKQQRLTINCSLTARNLRKSDLAGVIFGCKHSTHAECFSKKLFGLPAPHYSYVKNIEPGLPLFLFNYSDRKLHGIFEAASTGQLAINSSAWTAGGSEKTPYAAQVKIRIRVQCHPLLEDQFRPIIADNYYEPKLFWFELDQAQTNKLISMFSSSPITSASLSKKTEKMSAQFKALRPPNAKQECGAGETSAIKLGVSNMNLDSMGGSTLDPSIGRSYSSTVRNMNTSDAPATQSNVGWFTWKDPSSREERELYPCSINNEVASNRKQDGVYTNINCDSSYPCVLRCPQKKWSALFKEETCSGVTKEVEEFNLPASDSPDLFDGERESPCLPYYLDENSEVVKASLDLEESGKYGEVASLKPNCEVFQSSLVTEPSTSCLQNCETLPIAGEIQESEYFQLAAPEANLPFSGKVHNEWSSSRTSLGLKEEKHNLKVPQEENALELPGEDMLFKSDYNFSLFSFVSSEIVPTHNQLKDTEVQSTNLSFPEAALTSRINSSSIDSTVAKLLFEVEEMRLSQFKQAQKINSLEQNLVESRLEIQQLKDQCRMLETGFVARCVEADDLGEEEYQSVDDQPYPACDGSICLVGGFDGCSWLSALDIYSSSQDLMRTWTSMSFVHSYASAAKFNDEVYVLGGVDGNLWYDTVESYNPVSNQWTSHPPLKQRKGSFSVLSLKDSIFVFGGGNGVECFSEVEMFDPNTGRWIPIQSLLHKRFAPAAAEVNGILYVAGGYNGKDYLKSIERLDPREHSWEKLESMATKRACHSLVVLNEKLYAIGGFDGTRMVSTVEVFDPHAGSWMMEESMRNSRGYFGSVVIRDEIHVIGGLQGEGEVLDKVETYKVGHGWQVKNWKAMGKRCFFSAVLL
ncbi:Beta-propeller, Kelch repeat type 1, Development/cell death domain, Kelch related, Kelch-type beta propeller-like protein isoform 1 [Theobroma cacao]|uniref:Beta-propeller, Kelch repeat type 1, Development/cell death domain, Kelch related, Kelch-type beta propeller-like protein isoform 1 n=2 Tax=Theobroma cacao TaxID=3641 RepID=A0A061GZ82_THECC|nr:Beta-propeller, Kelch repeat type 1, Development/cell death domain, Kelch related, Kelch-type beta propeller-like protein isoform 1 [Theobroma cacao]